MPDHVLHAFQSSDVEDIYLVARRGLAVSAGLAEVGPVATGYVLVLAVAGPVLARFIEPLSARVLAART